MTDPFILQAWDACHAPCHPILNHRYGARLWRKRGWMLIMSCNVAEFDGRPVGRRAVAVARGHIRTGKVRIEGGRMIKGAARNGSNDSDAKTDDCCCKDHPVHRYRA